MCRFPAGLHLQHLWQEKKAKSLEEVILLAAGAGNMFKIVPNEEKLKTIMPYSQKFRNCDKTTSFIY